jgi:hypothetical protein
MSDQAGEECVLSGGMSTPGSWTPSGISVDALQPDEKSQQRAEALINKFLP